MSAEIAFGWYAFIDERGEPNLDVELEGVSHYFILGAVIVDGRRLESVRVGAEEIRRAYFQTGPMKSSGVSDNAPRRLQILGAIAKLEFSAHFLVVDKAALSTDGGFPFRRSFLKFFHGQVYNSLFHAHSDMKIVAEPFGKPDFRAGFKKYVEERTSVDLFRRSVFDWGDKTDPLLQTADFLAGSLGIALEPDKRSIGLEQFQDVVGAAKATYDWWPPYKHHGTAAQIPEESAHDRRVREFCFGRAVSFLEQRSGDETDEGRCQVAAAKVLLQVQQTGGGTSSIHRDELVGIVQTMVPGITVKGGRWFQRYVIASLRDDGVIITSGPQGYKLPTSVADVKTYGRDVRGRVEPMLQRLKSARAQLKMMTAGALDILGEEEFELLRSLVERVALPVPEER